VCSYRPAGFRDTEFDERKLCPTQQCQHQRFEIFPDQPQKYAVTTALFPSLKTNEKFCPKAETILAHLRQDWPEAKSFLERLVRLNSHTGNSSGIEANVDLVVKEFAPMGFRPRRIASPHADFSSHLVLDNHAPGPVVLMVSHLDTVYTPAEQNTGFRRLETPDGFLTGPGTMDIKGGTVMMWMLLRAWLTGGFPGLPSVRWILAWNASEEQLPADFSTSIANILPEAPAACLVFEADNRKNSGHEVVTSRKGLARWKIHVRGKGAHSGSAHAEGLNAIARLAEIVARFEKCTNYDTGLTVNVGMIAGGVSTNRVPESASAEFEVRYLEVEDYELIRARLLEWNDAGNFERQAADRRCEVILKPVLEVPSWPAGPGAAALAEVWREAGAFCGYEVSAGARGGLSDANYFGLRYPTLDGLGPRGGNPHTVERTKDGFAITEYVEPESFLTKGLINFLAIHRMLSRSDGTESKSFTETTSPL
jgi:glutamate carboxypeptidase